MPTIGGICQRGQNFVCKQKGNHSGVQHYASLKGPNRKPCLYYLLQAATE